MLTKFAQSEIIALVRLLNLPVYELEPNSRLYCRLLDRERLDDEYGVNLVADVQNAIADLVLLEDAIAKAQSDRFYGASEVEEDIDGEYSYRVKYGYKTTVDEGLKSRYRFLIRQIKRSINWMSDDHKICLG